MPNSSLFKHGYALLIGVGADLPVTIQDAKGLRDILVDSERCAYPSDQVKLLTEGQATRQGILDGLDWLIAQIPKNSQATSSRWARCRAQNSSNRAASKWRPARAAADRRRSR